MSKSKRIYDGEPPGGIAIKPKSETDEVTALEDVNESIKHRIVWREKCLESLKDDLMKAIYKEMGINDAR